MSTSIISTRRCFSVLFLLGSLLLLTACGGGGGGGGNPPPPQNYTVGGTVTGLAGSGLVLQNNGGDDLAIGSDGAFTFAGKIADGKAYAVTVLAQPGNPSQTCTVTNGGGTIAGADVSNVTVTCVTDTFTIGVTVDPAAGGSVSGAGSVTAGQSVTLTATANAGYGFVNWTENGSEVSTSASYSFTASADRSLVANFEQLAATPSLGLAQSKVFRFSWTDIPDATHYRLLENPDGASGFTQVGGDITQGTESYDHVVPLYARLNAQYVLQTCNAGGCVDSAPVSASGSLVAAIGYFKASNAETQDQFGAAVALSGDGNTLAVSARGESSSASGGQSDNSESGSGAVYVFTRSGGTWSQQAFLKASNAGSGDEFGSALSLSDDGNTLAVGAYGEASGAGGDQGDDSAGWAGAAYVFTRSGNTWSQRAYLKASNIGSGDEFGSALSLSDDGNTLVVGAWREDSAATGVDGNQVDDCGTTSPVNCASDSGAVYVFARSGGTWSQQAYVKASNADSNDFFGRALALNADGNTLVVGARGESSSAGGNQADNSASASGAAYVFTRSGTSWSQEAYLKASNVGYRDYFGDAVTLSDDGNTLVVGAWGERSNAVGVDGDQTNDFAPLSGAAYVFTRSGGAWNQQAYLKASNTDLSGYDYFGQSLSLSSDGTTLAVGAYLEDSNATGLDGDQADDSATESGAVYLFTHSAGGWNQQAYLKAGNTGASDSFGWSLSLSGDGQTLAVGALKEDSDATGIGGDQTNDNAPDSGAVYLY